MTRDVACLLAEALDYAGPMRCSRTARNAHSLLTPARVLQPMQAADALRHPLASGRWLRALLVTADEYGCRWRATSRYEHPACAA